MKSLKISDYIKALDNNVLLVSHSVSDNIEVKVFSEI